MCVCGSTEMGEGKGLGRFMGVKVGTVRNGRERGKGKGKGKKGGSMFCCNVMTQVNV